MPKYVVSTTLQDPTWNNTTVISGDVAAEVAKLKRDGDGDILVGGSRTLAQSLAALGLVDEYRLMVFPIVLGSGMRLWGDTDTATTLKLTRSEVLGSGTAILVYEPVRD